jgi:asparagine synthase (glutamine-hydrolysing)
MKSIRYWNAVNAWRRAMSTIFGICRSEGHSVEEQQLRALAGFTSSQAPDGTFLSTRGRIGMGFQPIHTHRRSHLEGNPTIDECGNMLTLDGRLDNQVELCELLGLQPNEVADSLLVLRAFAYWKEGCFSKLVGDWALALWWHLGQTLYLARDHAGSRTLFFMQTGESIVWSTHLDTLVQGVGSHSLDRAYAIQYLACRPIRDLTPYAGIRAVAPAHYYRLREGTISRQAHWEWMVHDTVHYKEDFDYQEQFLFLFRQAVERRTGSGAPIVAELSGGMDSTAIVCVSDSLVKTDADPLRRRVDTVSYYDETEPGWDEARYFSITESLRGKVGIHIRSSFANRAFEAPDCAAGYQMLPGADKAHMDRARQLAQFMDALGSRVVLSGMGGDDLLGGIPSPAAELIEHIMEGRLLTFFRQSLRWCLAERVPVVEIFIRTLRSAVSLYDGSPVAAIPFPCWVRGLAPCPASELGDYSDVHGLLVKYGPRAIGNGLTWWAILETLPHTGPSLLRRYEYRYPYLDRDLVDFLLRVPRSQLARPGRRRYMMRQALRGIVPEQILERRRKAYCARGPIAVLRGKRDKIEKVMSDSILEDQGLINIALFHEALRKAARDEDPALALPIMRTVDFELWLRASRVNGLVA